MFTKDIATYAEKVHENFPQIPVVEIVKIWCEQYGVSETEFLNTNLENMSNSEMVDFIFEVHEKFPENSLMEMFEIWAVEEYKHKTSQIIYID